MTVLDYLIIATFSVFAIWGLVRGLIAEVFSLVSWFAALFVGARFGEVAKPLFTWFGSPTLQGLAASLFVGIVVYAIVSIIGVLINRSISGSVFAPLNRMLGLLFGSLRGAIVIGFIVLIGLQFGLQDSEAWQKARLRMMANTSAELLDTLVDFKSLVSKAPDFKAPEPVLPDSQD